MLRYSANIDMSVDLKSKTAIVQSTISLLVTLGVEEMRLIKDDSHQGRFHYIFGMDGDVRLGLVRM